ncbi:MAG: trypsin-like peptidase domain-containing protein [Gammaproteobacteria bacterium]|nr:trypsin-like peptidase domain-containing protein [Gammaproteobacteria bacterium]
MPISSIQLKSGAPKTVPVVDILSGRRRCQRETLSQETYCIVMEPGEALLFLEPDGERTRDFYATLHRAGDTYELEVIPQHDIWVNGREVKVNRMLESGDLLEIGHGGPVFRYRMYPPGIALTKTVTEAVADSFSGAQVDGHTRLGKTSRFLTNITRDLATQTTLWFRLWLLILLTAIVGSIVILAVQNVRLQKRVATEDVRIEGIEGKLEQQLGANTLSRKELLAMQKEVETHLSDTFERLAVLEAGTGKASRVIAAATPSVAFLLGTYGYVEPGTGRHFRYIESGEGGTWYTLEEEGRVVEFVFTGTAFVVANDGILLTNRHVIEPWNNDPRTDIVQGRQLIPVILQLLAYFPGASDPFTVKVVQTGEQVDLVLLQPDGDTTGIAQLEFEPRIPQPGDEVLLLGYPTGMRALVARASTGFLESITPDGPADYWTLAQRLSEAGYIKPLASRGIVSQVTEEFIVYDAETTFGGSGGPVLDLNGHVIAINAAVIPEFGGSNMGVPADRARRFLAQSGNE